MTGRGVGLLLGIGAVLLVTLERRTLMAVAAVTALAATWVALTHSSWGSKVRKVVVEAVLLQVAVLMAGINGIRGHWQVWDG